MITYEDVALYLTTVEAMTLVGHPARLARAAAEGGRQMIEELSDTIPDDIYAHDPRARYVVECEGNAYHTLMQSYAQISASEAAIHSMTRLALDFMWDAIFAIRTLRVPA